MVGGIWRGGGGVHRSVPNSKNIYEIGGGGGGLVERKGYLCVCVCVSQRRGWGRCLEIGGLGMSFVVYKL